MIYYRKHEQRRPLCKEPDSYMLGENQPQNRIHMILFDLEHFIGSCPYPLLFQDRGSVDRVHTLFWDGISHS